MNIGFAVEELRKKRGLKQYELASKVGITQTYLSMIERNKKDPTPKTIKQIAEALGVPPKILLFLSLTESDATEDKKDAFSFVMPLIKSMIEDYCVKTETNPPSLKKEDSD